MKDLIFRPTLFDRLTMRHFMKSVPALFRAGYEREFDALIKAEKANLTDRVTQGQIIFVASALSFYRVLRVAGFDDEDAKARLLEVIMFGQGFVNFVTRIAGKFSRDQFKMIRKYAEMKAQSAYGPSFDIRVYDFEDGFVSEVLICGYREFLKRHNGLEINEILCEWDRVWIDALPDGIEFSRPCTLAKGCESCRFEFRRSD